MTLKESKQELCSRIMRMRVKELKGIYVLTGDNVWNLTIRQNKDKPGGYEVYQW